MGPVNRFLKNPSSRSKPGSYDPMICGARRAAPPVTPAIFGSGAMRGIPATAFARADRGTVTTRCLEERIR